jgi:hypothetical protein
MCGSSSPIPMTRSDKQDLYTRLQITRERWMCSSGVHSVTVVRQHGPRQQRPPIGGGVALSRSGGGRLGGGGSCRKNTETVSVLAA